MPIYDAMQNATAKKNARETLKASRASSIWGHWGAIRNVAVGGYPSPVRIYVLRRLVCVYLIFFVDIYRGAMRLCLSCGNYEAGTNA